MAKGSSTWLSARERMKSFPKALVSCSAEVGPNNEINLNNAQTFTDMNPQERTEEKKLQTSWNQA